MSTSINDKSEINESNEVKTTSISKEKEKKVMTMNLKTLFTLGIGAVVLICLLVALIMALVGKKVTVKFDSDGGSKVKQVVVKKGRAIKKPEDPIKEDYRFVEWQLDGKKYDFSKEVNKNITLKAVWEIELTDDIYTITFDSTGGSKIESQKINGNGKVIKPEDPTRIYSRFVEWQLDDETYDFNSLVKKDMTLKAVWQMSPSHEVTFDFDGGGQNYLETVYEGTAVEKPEDPEKEGYKFVEWQKNGQKYNFETPVIDDITLKAKYEEAKTYEVKFDSDGGTVIESQKVKEGSKATKPSDPAKNNSSFAGWQLNGVDFDFNSTITSNIILKAKWKEIAICNVMLIDNYSDGGNLMGSVGLKCGSTLSRSQIKDAIKDFCSYDYNESSCNVNNWYYNNSVFDFNTVVNNDITLKNSN